MIKQYKVDEVNNLISKLKEKGNFILTDYSGVKVNELRDLRNKLRNKDVDYKVVKNNLFKRALNDAGYEGVDEYLKGPVAVAFFKDEIGEVAKVLKDFSAEQDSFSYSAGVLDNILYEKDKIKKIAELPSKDIIISQVMSLINGPSTNIVMGIHQVMASLARGIKAVAEAN